MIDGIITDVLKRLHHHGWIAKRFCPRRRAQNPELELMQRARDARVFKPVTSDWQNTLSQRARVEQVIEYVRLVHAEMAALMSAVRRGISVRGATLYTTTFPCHECARHIVAAGIARVVFIEPYPKSRAESLYYDAVAVDGGKIAHVPFLAYVGVAPRAYARLFVAPKREKDGLGVVWEDQDRTTLTPRDTCTRHAYLQAEQDYAEIFFSTAGLENLGPSDRLREIGTYLAGAAKEHASEEPDASDSSGSLHPSLPSM
jgi:deoxycytidylate deaminase